MPPEGYYERQLSDFLKIFSEYRNRGQKPKTRLSAKEQVAKIESDRLIKSLANEAIKYHNEFSN